MKQRSTTSVVTSRRVRVASLVVALLFAMSIPLQFTTKTANADQYDEQINAIQQEINRYQGEANRLAGKAKTYEAQLAKLSNEKATIQKQLDLTRAQHDQLVAKIKQTEKDIATNRDALGDTIASMAVDGEISPLEMLASSNNISDYLDKQEYQASVRDQLVTTIDEIKDLKAKLEKQKKDVAVVLANQKNARDALAAKEAEQAKLVNQTRGEESVFRQLTAQQEAAKAEVQRQQQAAIEAALFAAGGGGAVNGAGSLSSYASWQNRDCYVDGSGMSNTTDPLGYGCNQCVSYTAYMMITKGHQAPLYWGNANQWPAAAGNAGFTVSGQARSNSLGVIYAGGYGHIVYVHNYDPGSNTVDISQYNYNYGSGWGKYSTQADVPAGAYNAYIYL